MAFDWNPLSWPSQFFQSASGDVASGISTGVEVIIHDVWNKYILPADEIGIGVILLIIAFAVAFQGQILQVASIIAAVAP